VSGGKPVREHLKSLGVACFVSQLLLVSTAAAQLVPLNPYLSQQGRFTNVNYSMYPNPFDLTIPLLITGNIRAGPLAIHPHFGMAESYTDNVFRTREGFGGRNFDWYTTYAPGLQVKLPILGRHRWVFDYKANIERYSRNSSQNVEDQTIATNLVFDSPTGLFVSVIGELKTGHDYRGAATSTGTLSDEPNKFYTPSYGGEVKYAQTLFVRARVKTIRWEFIGPNAGPRDGSSFGDINTRNRLENYVALAVGGRVMPKTYLFVEGWVGEDIYEINKDLDSTTYTATLGGLWEITGKTNGQLNVGWQRKNMDRASARGSNAFNGLYFNGSMTWSPQEQTNLNLDVYRRTNETVLGGTLYFVSTGTVLNVSHAFTNKWRVVGQFMYNHDTYSGPISAGGNTATRGDDYITIGAGLWYQIQPWLGARANYTYTERLSNFESVTYNASVTMVSLQAQF
jgi:hypothetical protein